MSTSSSNLSSALEDIIRRDANSVEILAKLMDLTSTSNDVITIDYTNVDGTITSITVPSYKYLLSEINRISKNFDSLSNSDSIVVKDSSGNNILFSKATILDKQLSIISAPVSFNAQIIGEETMLNPLINMEVPVNSNTDKFLIKKVLANLDNTTKLSYFQSTYMDKVLKYSGIKDDLASQGITFIETEFETSVKRKNINYFGNFDVINSRADKISVSVNGTPIEKNIIYYKLNSLYYSDKNSNQIQIKKNDLLVTTGNYSKYSIDSILTDTNEISLKLIEGYGAISIGVNILSIAPSYDSQSTLLIPVKPEEYCLYFIKSIDSINNSIAGEWINGFGVFTSNMVDSSGNKLYDFYNTKVNDINRTIQYVNNDKLIPRISGVKPNTPVFGATDFKVLQINAHKNDSVFQDTIKKNLEQKDLLKKDIELVDKDVVNLRTSLSGSSNINSVLIEQTSGKIDEKLIERSKKLEQYNSIIDDLVVKNKEIADYSPKYAIRGFIPIPDPVYQDEINKVGKQDIVQFLIGYRYLSKDGTTNNTKTFSADVQGKQVSAEFGPWIEIKTKNKNKSVDEAGNVIWEQELLADSNVINFNQLSIPISVGEKVEIRIKSIGEAGYPYSPIESDWSESLIIDFPEEFAKNISQTTDTLGNDKAVVELKKELEAAGMNKHISDSLTIQEKYFSHQATNIATSISDANGKLYDVDSYMKILKQENADLYAILNKSKAKVNIQITDSNGNIKSKVNNFDTIKLFAGFYTEDIQSLPEQKGQIVSKLYYINIQNDGDADMEILPYQPGIVNTRLAGIDYTNPLFPDDLTYFGYMHNKSEYDSYRKYHRVPISLLSILNDNDLYTHYTTNQYPHIQLPAFQSMQSKGQYIYSRHMDVSLTEKLYENPGVIDSAVLPMTTVDGLPSTNIASYVWNGTMGATQGNGDGLLSDFCVHTDHPDLHIGTEFFDEFSTISYSPAGIPRTNVGGSLNNVKFIPFTHTPYFSKEANQTDGTKQLEYIPFLTQAVTPTVANFARKIAFTTNDRYLIGKKTCGSYLVMGAPDYKNIYTGSAIYSQGIIVKKNDAIRIPILFQYRMTDYGGTGNTGIGNIGGYGRASSPVNLTYTKKIGLDLVIKDLGLFSFDVEVTAKYKPDSIGSLTI